MKRDSGLQSRIVEAVKSIKDNLFSESVISRLPGRNL